MIITIIMKDKEDDAVMSPAELICLIESTFKECFTLQIFRNGDEIYIEKTNP